MNNFAYILLAITIALMFIGLVYVVFIEPKRWMKNHSNGNEGTLLKAYHNAGFENSRKSRV